MHLTLGVKCQCKDEDPSTWLAWGSGRSGASVEFTLKKISIYVGASHSGDVRVVFGSPLSPPWWK